MNELFRVWYEQELHSAGKCCDECYQKIMDSEFYVERTFLAGMEAQKNLEPRPYSEELAKVERGEV
jgi:hypothetical protein